MPVCTVCAHPAEYLYTTYKTKSNIRLGVCAKCGNFLDPLIEHPPLLLLLDLILLKPRVYLHLLFNRGSRPHDVDSEVLTVQREQERSERLTSDFTTLALATLAAETTARLQAWSKHATPDGSHAIRILGSVMMELGVQHLVTTILAMLALWWKGWYPKTGSRHSVQLDGRQAYFVPIMISLTLFYTTLLPLALQLVLSIWYTHDSTNDSSTDYHLPSYINSLLIHDTASYLESTIANALQVWMRTDRIWAGTKLLGGMSAGFGLRVILPTRPWETTAIVLAGWGAASLAGRCTAHP